MDTIQHNSFILLSDLRSRAKCVETLSRHGKIAFGCNCSHCCGGNSELDCGRPRPDKVRGPPCICDRPMHCSRETSSSFVYMTGRTGGVLHALHLINFIYVGTFVYSCSVLRMTVFSIFELRVSSYSLALSLIRLIPPCNLELSDN
jgi:hypothetical protein